MILIGVDPGLQTGYAVLDDDKVGLGAVDLWHGLDALIDRKLPDAIIVENFRLFPHMARTLIGNELLTVRVIGVLQYLCEQRGIKLVFQEPSVKAGLNIIKQPGLRIEHPYDALAHIIYYLKQIGEPLSPTLVGFLKKERIRRDKADQGGPRQLSDFLPKSDPFQTKVPTKRPRRPARRKRNVSTP